MRSFLQEVKQTSVVAATAAGTSAVNGSVLDMLGFEGVAFTAMFGTLTSGAVTGIKVQHGDLANGSDMADLAGTALAIADTGSGKCLTSEVIKPRKRYVRVVVTRGTANAVIDRVLAFQFTADKMPVTQDATTIVGTEQTIQPAAGTA